MNSKIIIKLLSILLCSVFFLTHGMEDIESKNSYQPPIKLSYPELHNMIVIYQNQAVSLSMNPEGKHPDLLTFNLFDCIGATIKTSKKVGLMHIDASTNSYDVAKWIKKTFSSGDGLIEISLFAKEFNKENKDNISTNHLRLQAKCYEFTTQAERVENLIQVINYVIGENKIVFNVTISETSDDQPSYKNTLGISSKNGKIFRTKFYTTDKYSKKDNNSKNLYLEKHSDFWNKALNRIRDKSKYLQERIEKLEIYTDDNDETICLRKLDIIDGDKLINVDPIERILPKI